jgi:bifunctional non-homologous end joining protein LigD
MASRHRTGADVHCEYCGSHFYYDEGRRCFRCDALVCPDCLELVPGPLCPSCKRELNGEHARIEPMLAVPGDLPEDPGEWGFEYKWDGVRVICHHNGRNMVLQSRRLRSVTDRYPELTRDAGALGSKALVLDGEIVALDKQGKPDFNRLQKRMLASGSRAGILSSTYPVYYLVFDLLAFDSKSLVDAPYRDRRARLEQLGMEHPRIRVPSSHSGEGEAMLESARRLNLEGIMAKRLAGRYRPGERSSGWRKIKIVNQQEFVIGGWTSRDERDLKSLLLGYYEDHRLRYAGKVGTGFTEDDREELAKRLEELERNADPFYDDSGQGQARFTAPKLVAEVQFRRWPKDGAVQQASYRGLRTDKPPEQVIREGGQS